MSKSAGFTLIELLVVMVLIGLLATVAVVTVGGGNQGRELENETNRLHAILRMAADEAIFSNSEIGGIIEEDGYEFLSYDEEAQKWEPTTHSFLKMHAFPEWLKADFRREGEERELPKQEGNIGDNGLSDSEDEVRKKPLFMFFSSGEVSGFTIGLEIENDPDSRLEITVNEQDEIILPHVEDLQNES